MEVAPEHDLLAFAVDDVGRRIYEIHFLDTRTGEFLPDRIPGAAPNLVWAADGRTILYVRLDRETLRWDEVRRHRLGGAPEADRDRVVYREEDKEYQVSVWESRSRELLLIHCQQTDDAEAWAVPSADPDADPRRLVRRGTKHLFELDHFRGGFVLRTNRDAPDYRLVLAPGDDPDDPEHWDDLVPAREGVLVEAFELFDAAAAVFERRAGRQELAILDWKRRTERIVRLPGTLRALDADDNPEPHAREVRVVVSGPTTAPRTLATPPARVGPGNRELRRQIRLPPLLRQGLSETDPIPDLRAEAHDVHAGLGRHLVRCTGKKRGKAEEKRFAASYPFHPDLTEVFYSRWTQLEGFQRTRGILRTLAIGLREAEHWDQCPVIGPAVLLGRKDAPSTAPALSDLAGVATAEETRGKRTEWKQLLEAELKRAQQVQSEVPSLSSRREVEQAVVAVFLHSQPIGQKAHTPELRRLIGSGSRDRIELDKGLGRWRDISWFLDDEDGTSTGGSGGQDLPGTWTLGNRPNLRQMHEEAIHQRVTDARVEERLVAGIRKAKSLTAGAKKPARRFISCRGAPRNSRTTRPLDSSCSVRRRPRPPGSPAASPSARSSGRSDIQTALVLVLTCCVRFSSIGLGSSCRREPVPSAVDSLRRGTDHNDPEGLMAPTAATIGRRLRFARRSRRITQDAVAATLGVPRSAISLMESGRRQVSSIELAGLADLYGRSFRWFVDPKPPSERDDAILALFRAAPDLEGGEAQRHVSRCLRLFRTGASLRRLLGDRAGTAPPRYEVPTPRSVGEALAQGARVAEEERHRLDLGQAPLRLPGTFAGSGIWPAALELPDDISGFFLNSPDFGMGIVVNLGHVAVRRRFSYAHEYAHALMDRDSPATVSNRQHSRRKVEQRANAFAAAFLMPEAGVRSFLSGLGKRRRSRSEEAALDAVTQEGIRGTVRTPGSRGVAFTDVALLARHFGVSYEAATWRLKSVRLTVARRTHQLLGQKDAANRYLRAVRASTGAEAPRGDLATKHRDPELEVQVLHLALEASRRDVISSGRLREIGRMLEIDQDILRDLAA